MAVVFSKLSHVKLKDGSFPFSAADNKKRRHGCALGFDVHAPLASRHSSSSRDSNLLNTSASKLYDHKFMLPVFQNLVSQLLLAVRSFFALLLPGLSVIYENKEVLKLLQLV